MLSNVTPQKKEGWKALLQISHLQIVSQILKLDFLGVFFLGKCSNLPSETVWKGYTVLHQGETTHPPQDQGEPQTITNWLSASQGAALTVFPRCPSHLPSCGPLSFGMWALCNEGGKTAVSCCRLYTNSDISAFCVEQNAFTCEHVLDLLTYDNHRVVGKPPQRSG